MALVLLTGQRPLKFIKGCFAMAVAGVQKFREHREARKSDLAKRERMDSEREKEKEKRRKEREAAKLEKAGKKEAKEEEKKEPQAELPLREIPTPQIIDASQRRIEAPKPGEKLFDRKKAEGHQMLTTDGFEVTNCPGLICWMRWRRAGKRLKRIVMS